MDDNDIPEKLITEVIARVVAIQKQFAHEWTGVRTERRAEVKDALSALVAEYLEQ
jgi:hypothetical protein